MRRSPPVLRFSREDASPLLVLFLLWLGLFLGRLGEAQLKYDALLYGALAKHMLVSGDWRTPHYSAAAYPNWYPHPPGLLWMAALFFKVLGVSTVSARLMPSLFAAATTALVYVWGRALGSRWTGLVAGVILLTSTRYLKYASDLVIDGPLAFWMVAGCLAFLRGASAQRRAPWVLAFGFLGAAAFVTKGLISAALFGATLAYAGVLCLKRRETRPLRFWLGSTTVAALFVAPWPFFFGGADYLSHYWHESVSYRLLAESPWAHLSALGNLLRTYWPWLPFLGLGLARASRRLREKELDDSLVMACLAGAVIFAGFSYSGHFLEHYLVPFYPFAALVAALSVENVTPRFQQGAERVLFGLAIALLAFLAVWPYRVRTLREEPIREAAQFVARRCPASSVTQVIYTAPLTERWLGLAALLWETPWDALWVWTPPPPTPGKLLLAASGERVPPGWERVDGAERVPFVVYRPQASAVCP